MLEGGGIWSVEDAIRSISQPLRLSIRYVSESTAYTYFNSEPLSCWHLLTLSSISTARWNLQVHNRWIVDLNFVEFNSSLLWYILYYGSFYCRCLPKTEKPQSLRTMPPFKSSMSTEWWSWNLSKVCLYIDTVELILPPKSKGWYRSPFRCLTSQKECIFGVRAKRRPKGDRQSSKE